MSLTYIRFGAALKAQDIDRKAFLPAVSRWQPYAGYWAFFWAFIFLWQAIRSPNARQFVNSSVVFAQGKRLRSLPQR
jgi:hypothetical protein